MKVRITNLPADIGEGDIRGLLEESGDIVSVEVISGGDAADAEAIVEMSSDAAGEGVVQLVNGRVWKGTALRAAKLLY